ncbi:hypothetical protein Tsubulata_016719 [Turnera subulata]|uniref:CCHC-type domain-containing protein n=1 Tax=Turnera subulata TaxID=218843 RepID=A0A9Q0GAB5_9ROSI|nr:hypothetical protein Tsubulata_016719 [Turnera subulata]
MDVLDISIDTSVSRTMISSSRTDGFFHDSARLPRERRDGDGNHGSGGPLKPPDPPNAFRSSFKDKLLQWRTGVSPYRANDGFKLEASDIRVEMKEGGPSFRFSERFRSHIACPWVFSVITKVLGRRFSYRVICSKVASLWKPQGGFQVIDLANDYYLVRFERKEDYTRALAEGPWTIQGSYLTVQSWQLGFDVSKEPTKTVVWVQIPMLPVEWYRQDILGALAQQIGRPIRIDINTLETERAKFARLAIEVEFSKPLLGKVEIKGRWFEVCYEDIPDLCFLCGMVGHMGSQCPSAQTIHRHVEQQHKSSTDPVEVRVVNQVTSKGSGEALGSKFGAWMKVSRQVRPTAPRNSGKAVGATLAANPFELGSAMALLKEVMQDAADAPSSPVSQSVQSVVGDKMGATSTLGKDAVKVCATDSNLNLDKLKQSLVYPKRMHGHAKPVVISPGLSNNGDDMDIQEEQVEAVPSVLKCKVQFSKVVPTATVASTEAGIPKQFRKANIPLMDPNAPHVSSLMDVKTMRGLYLGGNKVGLAEHGSRQEGSSEPRISGNTADRVIRTLGFQGWQKRRLLQRLRGVELALNRRPNRFLRSLEAKLRFEYEQTLIREELIWMQKSECKWLQLGDRNTHFFHLITKARRRKNQIEALQIETGEWVYDSMVLQRLAVQFFSQLYVEEGSQGRIPLPGGFLDILIT